MLPTGRKILPDIEIRPAQRQERIGARRRRRVLQIGLCPREPVLPFPVVISTPPKGEDIPDQAHA